MIRERCCLEIQARKEGKLSAWSTRLGISHPGSEGWYCSKFSLWEYFQRMFINFNFFANRAKSR